MRRRKQRNPLLMRIIVISIAAHIVALPVLAHFGAFKKIKQQFIVGEVKMVTLPPPPTTKPPEEKKQAKAKAQKPSQTAKKASHTSAHQQRAAFKSNLNQPHVAVASASGGGDAGGGVVDEGSGKAGELPTPKADVTPPTVKAAESPKPEPPAPKTDPKTDPAQKANAQIARAIEPKPEVKPEIKPEPAPAPHQPVFTDVTQTFAPQPSVPDDLRAAALDKTVVVEITVDAEGNSSDVKLAQPTGNDELDRIALETARKWKFKPATRDGQPIESRVRLHIEFQVS
jgi:protein TonB